MQDDSVKAACILHGMEMLRRWVDELEGSHRTYAFELMNMVMAGELTNDEAFSLLSNA
jgi:hypothetical protein